MSATPDETRPEDDELESAPRRTKRDLEAVFGDILPSQTRDDLDPVDDGMGSRGRETANDDRLREDVPPHHGS